MNVEVIDHIIISEKTYYGFVDSGLFAKLLESKKFVLPYQLEERARNKGIEIGKAKGEKKVKTEMAKVMKADGESIDKIEKYTQLLREEIEKL